MDRKEIIRQKIVEQLDFSQDISDSKVMEMIHLMVIEDCKDEFISLKEKQQIARDVFYSIRKLDLLQELVEDPTVSEIMINGTDNIYIEKKGRLLRWNKRFEDKEKLYAIIQQMVAGSNRAINEASPIVDARLPVTGARVNVVLAPVSVDGPSVTIRQFSQEFMNMESLVQIGSITTEAALFLKKAVNAGLNILVSGGTGSGKTTFLNALARYISSEERVICIEDSSELQIRGIPNLVRLETRNATQDGCIEITIRDLIKTALRMRPDRLVVGEVRGSEAVDMLQAMNTGHDGCLSTAHANSAIDVISRLETMVLMGMELPLGAIRAQIASGVDLVVHLGRLRDKSRKVLEIAEVCGLQKGEVKLQTLYLFEETQKEKSGKVCGGLVWKKDLENIEKFKMAGLL